MSMQSLDSRRTVILVFLILTVLFELTTYEASVQRPAGERFFQMYILGANHKAANYYPQNDTDIRVGSVLRWYLGITNNMGSAQFVEVQVKLANQTTQSPDDLKALESPAPAITDFAEVMLKNGTWEFPFVWSVENASMSGGSAHILTLEIDNQTYSVSSWAGANGYNFRLIFELWTWQPESNTFGFGWASNGERHAAWLQVWFNMTNVSPIPMAE